MNYSLLTKLLYKTYKEYCQAVKEGDMFTAELLETKYTNLYNKKQKYDFKNRQREHNA